MMFKTILLIIFFLQLTQTSLDYLAEKRKRK